MLKALTICQPYAHLIAIGTKRAENRTWDTAHRGPVCWALSDIKRLPEPVPCRGHQGLWALPPDVAEAVLAQWHPRSNTLSPSRPPPCLLPQHAGDA